jgi:protein disulfide-isomerase A6
LACIDILTKSLKAVMSFAIDFILVKSLVNGKLNHMLFHVYRHGKIYLKAAKTCMVKGAGYAKNEIERLQRMLEKVRLIDSLLVEACHVCKGSRTAIL